MSDFGDNVREYPREHNPVIISVNFRSDFDGAYSFFRNQRRYSQSPGKNDGRIIIPSNVKPNDSDGVITVKFITPSQFEQVFM